MKSALAYLCALVAIVILAVAQRRGDVAAAPPPRVVASTSTLPATPVDERSFTGILLARQTVDVGAKSASVVHVVNVAAGDAVDAGAVLVRMDARARAQAVVVADAEARDRAERARRREELRAAKVVSGADADAARYEAIVTGARLAEARILLGDATISAPFDGIVAARFVEPSQHVDPGQPILRLVSRGTPRLKLGVPPADAARLAVGDEVTFVLASETEASSDARGRATVVSIAPEVDPSVDLVVIEAEVPPEHAAHRSGSHVRVFLAAAGTSN